MAIPITVAAPQANTPLVNGDGTIQSTYSFNWLTSIADGVNASPRILGAVTLLAQSVSKAGIVSTPSLPEACYRISTYLRVTQAGSVSSSLQVQAITWTENGVASAINYPALTTNTSDTLDGRTAVIRCDAGSAIGYAVGYASSGATLMQYTFCLRVEHVT